MERNSKFSIKKAIIPVLGLLGIAGIANGQTPVKVHYLDGTEQTFNVAAAGKLYFSNASLMISLDGTTTPTTIPVALIRKIMFEGGSTTGIKNNEGIAEQMHIFPNPAQNYFRIEATGNELLNVRILDLNGKELSAGKYKSGSQVAIAHLSQGVYIVNINKQYFKLVKQ